MAASSPSRLHTPIPAYAPYRSQWTPTGLITTVEQVRALVHERTAITHKVDFRQARAARRPGSRQTSQMQGPCLFGCATSSNSAWYKVPTPSPWPGVRSGETLSRKYYLRGISNKRTAVRRRAARVQLPANELKIGNLVSISGLINATHFNGKLARLLCPEDDSRCRRKDDCSFS